MGAVVGQIAFLPQTYTSIACFMNGTSTVDQVFTVRVGPGATVASTLTCTIPAGSNSGSSTGVGSATVAPGNILDIATQGGTGPPSVFGSFALAP